MTKHLLFIRAIFCLLVIHTNLKAQISEADQYKIDHPTHIPITANSSRSGEPGSDCEYALSFTTGSFTFLPTIDTQLPNIIAQGGALASCLGSAPNQTWFAFQADSVGVLNIILNGGQADYDFILFDATGFPCEEFDNYSGILPLPEVLDCSYSGSALENIDAQVAPGRTYYLVVTNFANISAPFSLDVQCTVNILPVNSGVVSGKVYADINNNCEFDAGDFPVSSTTVLFEGTILYTSTDPDGNYSLMVPIGSAGTISVSNDNLSSLIWQTNCTEQEPVFVVDFGGTDEMTADVAFYTDVICALPSVVSSTPFLRRCFTSTRTVQYCNQGTIPTTDQIVTLRYDEGIVPVEFSVPFTQNGNEFSVEVGSIAVGGCNYFTVVDSVTCENGVGSFGLVEARIAPQSDCINVPSDWDLSDLEVYATCADTLHAVFTVSNTGSGNMGAAMPYEIKRNGLFESIGVIQLDAGSSQTFTVDNHDDMVTFEVSETFGNPYNSIAWAFSDCGSSILFGGTAPGLAINDQQPWFDQDIEMIIGAYDPNDKFAWPFGEGEAHNIDRNDDIEYRIRFQNTGNDTAFTIVIVDTLSDLLNPASLRITGNSHQYIYDVDGQVLTVTFPNIMLVDSTTNLEGSIGYIRFNIEQMEENPLIYQVNNFADIYFDFNPPIRTNTAVRTVGELLTSVSKTITAEEPKVYPVPASDQLSFVLPVNWTSANYTLTVIDMTGRSVKSQNGTGTTGSTSVAELAEGIYFAVFNATDGRAARVSFVVAK